MKRCTRMMWYFVSACLCLWYLTVISWALHPIYYINKQLMEGVRCEEARYDLREQLFFGTQENGMQKIKNWGFGWSYKESWGMWTIGKNAHLFFIINKKITSDLQLTMLSDAFCPEGFQVVDILANDIMIGTLRVKDCSKKVSHVTIPKELVKKDGLLHLEFNIQKPSSPQQYGLSRDNRILGIGMRWIKIESMDKNEYL